ncbi:MAG TPA: nucleotidyl transferase AbiEii/AbiGii toxin family protein [Steroidobacteraceae bacterium]|nr:nucleotidyl transferase AbiEii/AbiGii toxin family protein [Steroidobacteraceae bacterium]
MPEFLPHLEILPPAQVRLWPELSGIPRDFVLYGGTALALHLGHRDSRDFDFFSSRTFDVQALEKAIPFLAGARVVQREASTLTAIVERGGPVQISFFGVPELSRLQPPHVVKDNGLQVASLLDLAGTKASVVQVRAEARDYVDIDALMSLGNVSLPTALAAAAKIYGPSYNPEITLKALSYFDDGNLRVLPEEMKLRLVSAVRGVDLDHLPTIGHAGQHSRRDFGL